MASGDALLSIAELLGTELFVKDEDGKPTAASTAVITGKYVGLLFARRWTPACHRFLPRLITTYHQVIGRGEAFEIVLISGEATQEAFDEYYAEMPFAALPFDSPKIAALTKKFNVTVMPVLVMLSPEGRVLSANAKDAVVKKPDDFPWDGIEEPQPQPKVSLQSFAPYLGLIGWFLFYTYQGRVRSWLYELYTRWQEGRM